jgi:hypothetical protein
MSTPIYHWHHIIPRHAGGTDDPSNLVRLTVEEHADAHRLLWEQHGRLQDKLAWLGLSGLTDEAAELGQVLANAAKKRADVRSKISQIRRAQWGSASYREKQAQTRASADYKTKHHQGVLRRCEDTALREQQRAKTQQMWDTPDLREARLRQIQHPDVIAAMKQKAKERWSDPAYRAKMTAAQRRRRLRERES